MAAKVTAAKTVLPFRNINYAVLYSVASAENVLVCVRLHDHGHKLPFPPINDIFGEQVNVVTVPVPIIANNTNVGIYSSALAACDRAKHSREIMLLSLPSVPFIRPNHGASLEYETTSLANKVDRISAPIAERVLATLCVKTTEKNL